MTALWAIALALWFWAPNQARAVELRINTGHRLLYRHLPKEVMLAQLRFPTTSSSAETRAAYQGWALIEATFRPADVVSVVVGLDSGLIEVSNDGVTGNGKPLGTHAQETLLLGANYLELQLGKNGVFALRGGKLVSRVGGGVVFDAYALGLWTDLDLSLIDPSNPWHFRAQVLLPDTSITAQGKTSPLFDLEGGLRLGDFGEITLFAAAMLDGRNGVAPLLADATFRGRLDQLIEDSPRPITPAQHLALASILEGVRRQYAAGVFQFSAATNGILGWTGIDAHIGADRWGIELLGVLGLGQIDAELSPNLALRSLRRPGSLLALDDFLRTSQEALSLTSGLASITGRVELSIAMELGGFLLWVSGDEGFGRTDHGSTYHTFVSLSPWLAHTSIFFNGSISTTLASPVVTSIAPDGAGMVAGGLWAEISPWKALVFRPTLALMSATHASPQAGGSLFGLEADLVVSWEITDDLALEVDGAFFLPGKYYGDVPPGGQLIAGIVAHPQLWSR